MTWVIFADSAGPEHARETDFRTPQESWQSLVQSFDMCEAADARGCERKRLHCSNGIRLNTYDS